MANGSASINWTVVVAGTTAAIPWLSLASPVFFMVIRFVLPIDDEWISSFLERHGETLLWSFAMGVLADLIAIVGCLVLRTKFPILTLVSIFTAIVALGLNGFWLQIGAIGLQRWP
jgi:hypothetical protein